MDADLNLPVVAGYRGSCAIPDRVLVSGLLGYVRIRGLYGVAAKLRVHLATSSGNVFCQLIRSRGSGDVDLGQLAVKGHRSCIDAQSVDGNFMGEQDL